MVHLTSLLPAVLCTCVFLFCRLSEAELSCLKLVQVKELLPCIEIFIQWLEEGYYNFCDLSLGLKKQMSEEDTSTVENFHEHEDYKGMLLCELVCLCN